MAGYCQNKTFWIKTKKLNSQHRLQSASAIVHTRILTVLKEPVHQFYHYITTKYTEFMIIMVLSNDITTALTTNISQHYYDIIP